MIVRLPAAMSFSTELNAVAGLVIFGTVFTAVVHCAEVGTWKPEGQGLLALELFCQRVLFGVDRQSEDEVIKRLWSGLSSRDKVEVELFTAVHTVPDEHVIS